MPALPWTAGTYQPGDDTTLHVLASMLPLRRYGDILRFLRWTGKIRKQLVSVDGCAGYSLDARLLRKTFYTLSAWSDAEAMQRFVRSGQHSAAELGRGQTATRGPAGNPCLTQAR